MSSESEKGKMSKIVSWFTREHCLNGLIAASVAQLALALMLYLLAAVTFSPLIVMALISFALALLSHYRGDKRLPRVLLRVFFIVIILGVAVMGALSVFMEPGRLFDDNHDTRLINQASLWLTLSLLVLPPLLFLQPALSVGAGRGYRFDLVIMRTVAIAVFILSVLLCVFALEFRLYENQRLILTSVTYSPVIFGYEFIIPINIDNFLTRIMFCLCSAAFVLFSFVVRSNTDSH